MNLRQKISAAIPLLLWIAYPAIIFFGLHVLQPRYVAGLLALLLMVRWKQGAYRLVSRLSRVHISILAVLLVLVISASLSNSEILLRIYPAMMSLGMLVLFSLSLKYPPSIVEIFARLNTPNLDPAGVEYTRFITKIWCVFFVINCLIAIYTALYSSRDTWALYNGLIAYIVMGALFAGEWLVRRHFIPSNTPNA